MCGSTLSSMSSPTLLPSKYPAPIPKGPAPSNPASPAPRPPIFQPSLTVLLSSYLLYLSLRAFFIGSFLLPFLLKSRKSGFAFLASRTSSLIFVSMTSFINFNLWNSSLSRAELNPDFLIASILFSISLEDRTSC